MEESGADLGILSTEAEAVRPDGQTVMFVAVDGKSGGLIGVADPIKTTTQEAIRQLHQEKTRIVMVTGDSRATAEAVAKKLGIDDVVAEVLPQDKIKVSSAYRMRVISWPWPVTGSTTPQHWPRRKSASPWELVPT
jgi:Cu+-exporting ATPase